MTVNDLASAPTRDGNLWRFPSGRTLPVVSGGSDTATPVTPAPADPAAAAAPAPAAEPETFPAPVVHQLRQENAGLRQRAGVLADLHPDDVSALDPLFQGLRSGNEQMIQSWIAEQFHQLPESVRAQYAAAGQAPPGQQFAPQPPAAPSAAPNQLGGRTGDTPLTRAEFEAYQAQVRAAENEREVAAEFASINGPDGRPIAMRSPLARAVAQQAVQMSIQLDRHVPLAEAYQAFMQSFGGAPAPSPGAPPNGAAPGVPAVPSGQAATVDQWANMSPADRARQIVRNANGRG